MNAGFSNNESSYTYCIVIGYNATATSSYQIRIGFGANQESVHNNTFIRGIRDITTGSSDTLPLYIDSTGKLGTLVSSRKFKTDIEDLDPSGYYNLKPVTYNRVLTDGTVRKETEFGLIAEDVAEIHPNLVKFIDGKPHTVRYHFLNPIVHAMCKQLRTKIAAAEQKMKLLEARYATLVK